jgi:hypothetical protein
LDAVISEGVAESADPAVECDTFAEQVSEVDIDTVALPSGVSLLVCPSADWVRSISGEIAPTPTPEGTDESGDSGSLPDGIVGVEGLLACVGYPPLPTDWSLATEFPGAATEDGVAPPDVELPPENQTDGDIDPVIIVDPVVVDPQTGDPTDVTDPVAPPDTDLPPYKSGDWDTVFTIDRGIDLTGIWGGWGWRGWGHGGVYPICIMPLPVAVADHDGGMPSPQESAGTDGVAEMERSASDVTASQEAPASPSRPAGGEPAAQRSGNLAAAAVWLGNQFRGDADVATPPGGKRRTR